MKKSNLLGFFIMCLVVLTSGCATRKPIALDPSFWTQQKSPIAVAMTSVPVPMAHKLGPQGLLDVLINDGLAGGLDASLAKTDTTRVNTIAVNLSNQLNAKGFQANILHSTIDLKQLPDFTNSADPNSYTTKDFRGIDAQGAERLLLIQVLSLGTMRSYYGFIPLGAPQAHFATNGMLIELKTNKLLWNSTTASAIAVAEPWDQGPDFNNVINSVTMNIVKGAAAFEASFMGSNADVSVAMAHPVVMASPQRTDNIAVKLATATNDNASDIKSAATAEPPIPTHSTTPATAATVANNNVSSTKIVPTAEPAAPVQQVPTQDGMSTTENILSGPISTEPTPKPSNQQKANDTSTPAANEKIQMVEFRLGISSSTVERMAKASGCTGGMGAGLMTNPGPVEIYRMACENGKTFLASCELRQCTVCISAAKCPAH